MDIQTLMLKKKEEASKFLIIILKSLRLKYKKNWINYF